MKIQELIIEIREIIKNLFQPHYNVYEQFKKLLPFIQTEYQKFIDLIPQLNRIGMEIEINEVVSQLRRLLDAIEARDKILFYDTLNYEVIDTLSLYDEIKKIMEN